MEENPKFFIINVIILKIHRYYMNQKEKEDSEDSPPNHGHQMMGINQIKIIFYFP